MRHLVFALLTLTGCAASRASMPTLRPFAVSEAPVLEENHFTRDRVAMGEDHLREILAAPIFLEENARIGVLPVSNGYAPEFEVPVEKVPAALAAALDGSGLFAQSSELSSDFPITAGIGGLRELAARYRTEYLLLYRHRFSDAAHGNPLAAFYVTILGAFVVPGTTVESSGVLEATLFDVKTGTILFTVYERVSREGLSPPPAVEQRWRDMHQEMVAEAQSKLADQVLAQLNRLVASRPRNTRNAVVQNSPE
ncbi:MAG: hypothetical protein DI536_26095 [Archangium gephyra]|uniref:Lipoprotein n=1 Tax=Archangium gephyra TaxID=48 RepID=A0A2W5UFW3_9BACT|nr:MAG: hypothetical protein DI536_26095 [Archangium gephyra]